MSDKPRRMPYNQRARSLPHKYHYHTSFWWAALFYTNVLCIIAAGIGFFLNDSQNNAFLLIGLVFLAILVWPLGYLSRRKATCPLCKGTPLLDSRASKHEKAVRIFPFNYGTTNILKAIVARRLRCHFCGTPFDLLKTNLSAKNDHPAYEHPRESRR